MFSKYPLRALIGIRKYESHLGSWTNPLFLFFFLLFYLCVQKEPFSHAFFTVSISKQLTSLVHINAWCFMIDNGKLYTCYELHGAFLGGGESVLMNLRVTQW